MEDQQGGKEVLTDGATLIFNNNNINSNMNSSTTTINCKCSNNIINSNR